MMTAAGAAGSGLLKKLGTLTPGKEADIVILDYDNINTQPMNNAYGTVVQAAFQQAVANGGGRVIVMERYPLDRAQMQGPAQRVAAAARQADALFIPDGADSVMEGSWQAVNRLKEGKSGRTFDSDTVSATFAGRGGGCQL